MDGRLTMNRHVALAFVALISSACQSHRETVGEHANVDKAALHPFQVNRFAVFSQEAQRLTYPPGVDTVAYWDDGRFQIVLNNLFDNSSKQTGALMPSLVAFVQRNELVFFVARNGYLVLNLKNSTYASHPTLAEFSESEQAVFRQIDSELSHKTSRTSDIIIFDQKTLLPR